MLVKTEVLLTAIGIFLFQSVAWAHANPTKLTDSVSQQENIYEQLNFITEMTSELVDSSLLVSPLPVPTPPTVEGRLSLLKSGIPLDYNDQVQAYIDRYSTDRYRSYLSRMMGLGGYYFPIFEKSLEDFGVPKEIKYLSIVESALDPLAVSRVGATGIWQFMHATAKVYGLEIDRQLDERRDPVAASQAAARYLAESYERFGDWLLAIASYNCGPGNVLRAIKRSGEDNPDFWTIQRFLPKETRNYVPAFIATLYMLEFHEEHGIYPSEEVDLPLVTEVVNVQQSIPFSVIAAAIKSDESMLKRLNPAYKGTVIHGSEEMPRRLVLPKVSTEDFSTLYAVLHEPQMLSDEKQTLLAQAAKKAEPVSYTVRKGDTLSGIASKHQGATVSSIRTANNLKGNRIHPGMKLIITQ